LDTDIVWMTVATAFVVLMVPALGIFHAGLVKRRNVLLTFLQCMAVFAAVSIVWSLLGYSLVFGGSVGGFIGDLSRVGLAGVGEAPNAEYAPKIPEVLFLAFQAAGADGLLLGNPSLLVSELIGIVAVAAYSFAGYYAILKAMGMVTRLRVTPEEEGLDSVELGESLDE